jgi:preprotein translocase subunit SecA
MLASLFKTLIPSKNDRTLRSLYPTVDRIKYLENYFLSEKELEEKTTRCREELAKGKDLGEVFPELKILGEKILKEKTALCQRGLTEGKDLAQILPEDFRMMRDEQLKEMTEIFRTSLKEGVREGVRSQLESRREVIKFLKDKFEDEENKERAVASLDRSPQDLLTQDVLSALGKEIQEIVNEVRDEQAYEEVSPEILTKGVKAFIYGAVYKEMQQVLNEILPEAFAVVREASKRTLGMRHFDVQLMGGMVLHQGKIAEMKTGEGKTLVATLPVYLNALSGKGVHVVTVNDYLARRDRDWMRKIYEFLGLTVGAIQNNMGTRERQEIYHYDITYGTNNEFGFDYLRDNLKDSPKDRVQRELAYAIVDEVDSILIDEARTPLIISGEVEQDSHRYDEFKFPVKSLVARQQSIVNQIFEDTLKFDETDPDAYEKYFKLLQVEKGDPKNKRLLDYIAEHKDAKKMMVRIEDDLIRDKRLNTLQEGLLYVINEKEHSVDLTEEGQKVLSRREENLFVLPDLDSEFFRIEHEESLNRAEKENAKQLLTKEYEEKNEKLHNIHQLIRAYTMFEKDVDYVVHEGEVVIVDEFTGRMMPGRRWSDGLHQAVEAKEGVKIAKATQTVATITLQNYFRLYRKLAGMTGTAVTEAAEFADIYKLDVVAIPTNEPMIRVDNPDVVYKTERAKFNAVVNEIVDCYIKGQPALVGTVSIEKSEKLSKMLETVNLKKILIPEKFEQLRQVIKEREEKGSEIPHHVLNAKHHEKEAMIVTRAGQQNAVTIATNMAGRGTDIVLGSGVVALGGLHIIGTERHEARRIDNQLRGRSGRQGDPGSSRFYLSLEDDLMRIFGSDKVAAIMERFGVDENEPIEHDLVTRAIANAQKKVEGRNFEIRKQLLKYDDVNNKQREVIYTRRDHVIYSEDLRADLFNMIEDALYDLADKYAPEGKYPEDWDLNGLKAELMERFSTYVSFENVVIEELTFESLTEMLRKAFEEKYELKKKEIDSIPDEIFQLALSEIRDSETKMNAFLRWVMLKTIDRNWMAHLYAMDQLKEGIGLRGYGQKDPLLEYQKEGYGMFSEMVERVNMETVEAIFKFSVVNRKKSSIVTATNEIADNAWGISMEEENLHTNTTESEVRQAPVVRQQPKVGRNDPCPCGSGKKYKKCHGA